MNILRKLFGKEKPEVTSGAPAMDLSAAKKIFFDYACNHFYLSHDGAEEEYKKLGISEEQEQIWRAEYISLWKSKLSAEDLQPLDKLRNAYAKEALPDLINMANQGDSYARLNYASSIWAIIQDEEEIDDVLWQAKQVCIEIWTALTKEKLWISEHHRGQISKQSMKALRASTPEEYVRNYAQRKLREVR